MVKSISADTFKFLKRLDKNNNRDWFKEHKPEYQEVYGNFKSFMQYLEDKLQKIDVIESHKVMRIYRDIRFSKDKTPYKNNFGGSFQRATAARRGGFYLGIQPNGQSMIAGGFWKPESHDLKRVRAEIDLDADAFYSVLNSKSFKSNFGSLYGESLKNVPRGFDREHPAADLLKKKQYLCVKQVSDEEVLAEDFADKVIKTYKAMLPFFDLMSNTLTTNLNGESII